MILLVILRVISYSGSWLTKLRLITSVSTEKGLVKKEIWILPEKHRSSDRWKKQRKLPIEHGAIGGDQVLRNWYAVATPASLR